MLRLTLHQESEAFRILRLEGRLAGPWVGELGRWSEQVLAEGKELALDLAGLSFVEADGAALLSRLQKRGVRVANGTPYIEALLRRGEDQ